MGIPHKKTQLQALRKEALYEQLSVFRHYGHFTESLRKMQAIVDSEFGPEDKDRFAMLSNIADKHWRVVDRYLPTAPSDASSSVQSTVSALQRAVLRLAMPDATPHTTPHTQAHNDAQSPGNEQPELTVNTNTSTNVQDNPTSAD